MNATISKSDFHIISIQHLLKKIERFNKLIQAIEEMDEPDTLSLESLLRWKQRFAQELLEHLAEFKLELTMKIPVVRHPLLQKPPRPAALASRVSGSA